MEVCGVKSPVFLVLRRIRERFDVDVILFQSCYTNSFLLFMKLIVPSASEVTEFASLVCATNATVDKFWVTIYFLFNF